MPPKSMQSGAHLNPAVTLGVALCGEIRLGVALAYVTTQIIGGIIGAAFCRAVLPKMVYIGINGGAHELHVGPGAAVACETILNVVVVLVYILSVLDPKTKSGRAPLGIGFAVLACTLASAGTTGGSVNVARSFGPAVAVSVYNGAVWKDHYVYWVGAVFGAVIAAVLYRTFLASDGKQLVTWRFAEEFFRKISRNNDQMTSLN